MAEKLGAIAVNFLISAALSAVFRLLFPPDKPDDPERFPGTTSQFGLGRTRVWGKHRWVGVNVFWQSPDVIKVAAGGGSKKGKKGSQTAQDEFFRQIAFGTGEEVGAFLAWRVNGEVIYDVRPENEGPVNKFGVEFAEYLGGATQDPDPEIQADLGIANTPAFRTLSYVRALWPLTQFGNQIGNIEVLVSSKGADSFPKKQLAIPDVGIGGWPSNAEKVYHMAADPLRPFIYAMGVSDDPTNGDTGFIKYERLSGKAVYANPSPTVLVGDTGNGIMEKYGLVVDLDGFIWAVTNNGAVDSRLHKFDPNTLNAIAQGGSFLSDYNAIVLGHGRSGQPFVGGAPNAGGSAPSELAQRSFGPYIFSHKNGGGEFRIMAQVLGTGAITQAVEMNQGVDYVGDAIEDATFDSLGNMWTIGGNTVRKWWINGDPRITDSFQMFEVSAIDLGVLDPALASDSFNFLTYDAATGTLIIRHATSGGGPVPMLVKFDPIGETIVSQFPNITHFAPPATAPDGKGAMQWQSPITGRLVMYDDGTPQRLYVIDTVNETELCVLNETDYSEGSSLDFDANVVMDPALDFVWLAAPGASAEVPYRLACPRVNGLCETLEKVMDDLHGLGGYDAAEYDHTALAGKEVCSWDISNPDRDLGSYVDELTGPYFFGMRERDYFLEAIDRFTGTPIVIAQADIGAGERGKSQRLESAIEDAVTLPNALGFEYHDLDRDGETNVQRARRHTDLVPGGGAKFVRSRLGFHPQPAADIAEKLFALLEQGTKTHKVNTYFRFMTTNAGDLVDVTSGPNNVVGFVDKVRIGADWLIGLEITEQDASIGSLIGTAQATKFIKQSISIAAPTALHVLDLPPMANDQNDGGYLVAAGAMTEGDWNGTQIFSSLDGFDFTFEGVITAQPVLGFTEVALPDGTWTVDDVINTVDVFVTNGKTLASVTDQQVNDGVNWFLVGDEIMGIRDWTNVAENRWQGSHLIRGRRGTNPFVPTHTEGERFIRLDGGELVNVKKPLADIGVTRFFQAVTGSQTFPVIDTVTFLNTGVRRKPFSVQSITVTRDGSNNATFNWIERRRLPVLPPFLFNEPLDETALEFVVEFKDGPGGTIVRTKAGLSAATVGYTEAEQTTDGLTPGDPITFQVRQVSPEVAALPGQDGWGYPIEVTI